MSDMKKSDTAGNASPSDETAGATGSGPGSEKGSKPGSPHDPNAPTPQGEQAAKEQDDGAIPSPSY